MADRLLTYCSAPGCLELAEGSVEFAYTHPQRWNLCAVHMRPIRAALLPIIRPPAEPQLEAVVPGGDDATGYAT
jgi:hypothetical protein